MRAIIYNSLWIILEKFCFAGAGIISAMYIARYLGPENFGTLSYLVSIIALILPFIQLGSDNVLFNRIAKKPHSGMNLMIASLRLKLMLFIIFSIGLITWACYFLPLEHTEILLVLLAGTFFTLRDIYKLYYDATLASKVNLVINNSVLVLFVATNLMFAWLQLSLIWFAFSLAVRSIIPYMVRKILFSREQRAKGMRHKRRLKAKYSTFYNIYLLKVGFPLAISSLAIVIYTRIDQIMLAKFMGYHAVGIYSAALAISGGWVLVPMALITSFMSTIASERDARRAGDRVRMLYMITLALCAPVIVALGFFSKDIIQLIYGDAFMDSASILLICGLTSLCSVLGTISYRIILMHSGYRFVALKMPVIALLNIGLNYHFIPLFGIKGAALSTLLSEVISLLVLNAMFKKGLVTYQLFSAYKSIPKFIIEVQNYVKSTRQASL
ncbi:flippase [Acerihabitans arboris]|uniref:Oligosaccharide flippase family protein n=1 Tax=Acerihabitans arboris TaxID=2691583 RepID=A0A845SGZ3_9GAMM|nr:flippase [Acerihabitans arboris]NDL62587.1 oligosaccharide flippase family protein [Acerihabitans arboris]